MAERFIPESNIGYRSKMVVIVGATGTGKTTTVKQVLRHSQRRALIVSLDANEWTGLPITKLQKKEDYAFNEIRVHLFDPKSSLQRLQYFRNGIIVFDDCRGYFRARTSDQLHTFLLLMRHAAVDIFAIAHGFTEVPLTFFTFTTDFILFKTKDSILRRRAYIRNFDAVCRKVEEVNAIAAGKKAHPKDYAGLAPDGRPFASRKIPNDHYCDTITND